MEQTIDIVREVCNAFFSFIACVIKATFRGVKALCPTYAGDELTC